jgi:pilus assembly protein CpaF
MRPDRIVIGEIRDATALDLLNAANTGHDGSLTTLHSSSVDGAIDRVVNLVLESGEYDSAQALSLLANGFDFIVQINRFEDGSRRVEEIAEIPQRLELEAGKTVLRPIPIWKFIQDGVDENNRIIGHYEKVNDYSESLIKKHRLNNRPKLSLEEVYRLSDQTDTGA